MRYLNRWSELLKNTDMWPFLPGPFWLQLCPSELLVKIPSEELDTFRRDSLLINEW